MKSMQVAALCGVVCLIVPAGSGAQPERRQGTVYRSPSGTTLRLMLDEGSVGRDLALGEITFPPDADSGEHAHGALEVFYVLEGELEHVVNGRSERLRPGMSGYVRPPDRVRHRTGAAGAKAVVIWVPGDEAGRIVSRWKREP